MKIREIILEGGNVQIGDQEAERIDLGQFDRDEIVPIFKEALIAIDAGFKKMFRKPLWNPKLLASNKFLSGSSIHFFNLKGIPTQEFVKHKQTVGDIDTQVDKNFTAEAEQFLSEVQGHALGPATLIGYKKSVEQIITLWSFNHPPMNVQIDLEFVDYDQKTNAPTEWSAFSHSSDWGDITAGIKGVFHKYLLRALSTPSLRDVVVLSGKKETPKKVKTTDLAFAVTRGLRYKLSPVMDGDQQRILDGLPVYKEIPTSASTYETNLVAMCKIFFGEEFDPADVEKYWSFVGGIDLVKKYFNPEQQAGVILGFAHTLWGPGGQELYRGEPEKDNADKTAAFDMMVKTLGVPYDKATIDSMHKQYYQKAK